ncbi:hypothetical protein BL253_06415 [Pseudofrankia asymbiotica]|uniref:Uncharacterized protein n=1 Tax=Pseudofrankia asymbiotica TaxID=1834516 RepID=A0A1V2IGK6_9ACTN|nr:hypothetical protein BL253_06415 [Pseudofrankia asymbiotica]
MGEGVPLPAAPGRAAAAGSLAARGSHSDAAVLGAMGVAAELAWEDGSGTLTRSTAKKSSRLAVTGTTGTAGCPARGTH